MFCSKCGNSMKDDATFCPKCGTPKPNAKIFCTKCGTEVALGNTFCSNCGESLSASIAKNGKVYSPKSKLAAGLLGVFFGGLGVHNFYLGKVGMGVLQIIVSFATCGLGAIWGIVEGVMILTSPEPLDGEGRIMKD